jgi:hypothetical protein
MAGDGGSLAGNVSASASSSSHSSWADDPRPAAWEAARDAASFRLVDRLRECMLASRDSAMA